jgi:hypothetical protein
MPLVFSKYEADLVFSPGYLAVKTFLLGRLEYVGVKMTVKILCDMKQVPRLQ